MIKERDCNGRIKSKYKDEDFIDFCIEYEKNKNAKEISEREGIPLQTLYYYIRKLNYSQPKRIYKLDEEYFKNINSQNKAYILGFIMADGCICKSQQRKPQVDRLIINISLKDKCILEFIKTELKCDYDIKEYIPEGSYSDNPMCSLTINSMKLCSYLIKLGVIPNKTGHESIPKIQDRLKRHFIRGFLDGDGWIKKDKNNVTTIGFISCKEMLISIKNEIAEHINVHSVARIYEDIRPDKINKNIYMINYSHSLDIKQLKIFLYKNANFYLKRKYSKLT